MKPKVVVTQWVHREVIELLSTCCEVDGNDSREPWSRETLLRKASDAQAIMVFMPDSIDALFLDNCPELEVVGAALKGFDNFDVDACTARGIYFTNVPDLLTIPTAELTVGLIIGLGRKMLIGDRFVRTGQFRGWRPRLYGKGLAGSTVGILGMGAVGQATARLLKGFGVRLLYHDRQPLPLPLQEELQASFVSFEHLLAQSDFILSILPLTLSTYHLIDGKAIGRMRPGSYLINTGRGSVVDENAVCEALESGHLAGYAADVFEMEDWVLTKRPQTVPTGLTARHEVTFLTPHLGSAVEEVRLRIAVEAAHNIIQALKGRAPAGAINQPSHPRNMHRESLCVAAS